MNIRVILFNGIMAALMGAMLGLAVAHIGQREGRTRVIMTGGATLGFIVGVAQGFVRQQRDEGAEEYEESGSPKI
jgi:hypothetical protein